jgi:hypothetical protein
MLCCRDVETPEIITFDIQETQLPLVVMRRPNEENELFPDEG